MTDTAPSSSAAAPRPLLDAPRAFPASSKLAVLFKGPALLIAAVLVGAGAPMCGGAIGESAARTLFIETVDIPATVVSRSSFVVRGKNSSHTEWRVHARGTLDGRTIAASGDFLAAPSVGAEIKIRVAPSRPEIAVAFMGNAPRGRFYWLVGLAFALAGVAVAWTGIAQNRRHLRLLVAGALTRGKIVKKDVVPVKNGSVLHLTFAYPTADGATARSTIVVNHGDAARVTDESEEWLVYDPRRPTDCVILDALPDRVRVDVDGSLTPIPAERAAYRALPLALIAIALGVGLVLTGLFI